MPLIQLINKSSQQFPNCFGISSERDPFPVNIRDDLVNPDPGKEKFLDSFQIYLHGMNCKHSLTPVFHIDLSIAGVKVPRGPSGIRTPRIKTISSPNKKVNPMKNSIPSFVATAAIAAIALVVSAPSQAHPGGLDKNGCHHNSKTGDYHCHQGPNAGKSFASMEAMEQGGRGVQMKSESSPRDEATPRREKARDSEPARSTKSRKQKTADAVKQDETAESPKRVKTKEKADSDTTSKKTSARKKAKTGADEADDAGAKKTKKTSKKTKAEKSDDSAADKDTKPKKTKKKTKSESKDEASTKQ